MFRVFQLRLRERIIRLVIFRGFRHLFFSVWSFKQGLVRVAQGIRHLGLLLNNFIGPGFLHCVLDHLILASGIWKISLESIKVQHIVECFMDSPFLTVDGISTTLYIHLLVIENGRVEYPPISAFNRLIRYIIWNLRSGNLFSTVSHWGRWFQSSVAGGSIGGVRLYEFTISGTLVYGNHQTKLLALSVGPCLKVGRLL